MLMPMTWPLNFSSPPPDSCRTKEDAKGELVKEGRGKRDVVRGSYSLAVSFSPPRRCLVWVLTDLASLDESMLRL